VIAIFLMDCRVMPDQVRQAAMTKRNWDMRFHHARLRVVLLLTAPLLAGCLERGEPLPMSSVKTEDDDMYCRAGGKNAPGSPDYVYCRKDRDAQRNAAVVRADKKQQDLGEYMLNNPR
jgi:hypothetical protein